MVWLPSYYPSFQDRLLQLCHKLSQDRLLLAVSP